MSEPSNHEIRLASVLKAKGLSVRDIYGYMSEEFGDSVFHITRIIMSDGTWLNVEGEHDIPYIPKHDRGCITEFPEETEE